jgi:hypothetical protein
MYQPLIPSPSQPETDTETEFQANLLAASEESRHLFLEYYKRTHGAENNENENDEDNYWTWDRKRQQWYHTNGDTGSIVWFLG